MRRFNFLRVSRGDNLGDPEFWNRRFEDIDLRIGANEDGQARIDEVLDGVVAAGLARLDQTLTPLINNAYAQIAEIPSIFSATSSTAVEVGVGSKSFVVAEISRPTWVHSQTVFVRRNASPSVWMIGEVVSFDRVTGILELEVSDAAGSGTYSDWLLSVSGRIGPAGPVGPAGLVPRGVYSALTQYSANDVVRYDRSAWVAKVDTIGNAPPSLPTTSNAQWELLVERGADGSETGAFETSYSETVSGGSKTTFTIPGGYNPTAHKLVFLNGVLLSASAYTATNGTTVVLGSAASNGNVFEFRAYALFGIGEVAQLDQNLADLPGKDTALTNLGGTSVGRNVFKATDQAAARSAIGAAAASHSHAQGDISGLASALAAKANLASPAFTGAPTVPTPADDDNSQKAANTEWVRARLGAGTRYNKIIYTGDGVWTKPDGLTKVIVTVQAGGGAGGGCGTGESNTAAGPGGGGGGAIKTILAGALASSVNVIVGQGGVPAAAGPNNGGDGTSSSFGSHCSATGGKGGNGINSGEFAEGGAGGLGSGGDINLRGGSYSWGLYGDLDASATVPGAPGALGFAGAPGRSTSGNGIAAPANSGGGGSGGLNDGSTFNRSGGAGASGFVIVEEFF